MGMADPLNQMQINTIERRCSPYRYEKPGRPKATIRINRFWVTLMGGKMETPSARPVSKDKKNGGRTLRSPPNDSKENELDGQMQKGWSQYHGIAAVQE